MDSMQTRHRVLGDASWTREKVSEARMWLVTSRCRRIRAPKLKHAAWQNGVVLFLLPALLAHAASACSDPAYCRRHKTVRSMVGFSWFLTRSSIQVQARPVHQTRPNRGVGLRGLGPWPRRHRRPKPLLHKVDRPTQRAGGLSHCQNGRLDTQAVSLTVKWQTRRAHFSSRLSADCSFTSPFSSGACPFTKPTDTQAQLLPRQIHHCLSGARSPPSRLAPPFSFTSFSRPLPLSEHWAESIVRREEGRRRTSRSTTTVRTINSLLHLPTHM